MDMDDIQGIFFIECEEGLSSIENSLTEFRNGTADSEEINSIFRAVHSIKGGAGAFGHDRLQHFSHHLETLLDHIRSGHLELSLELLGLLFQAFDKLSDHVAAAKEHGDAPDDTAILEQLIASSNVSAPKAADTPQAVDAPVVADTPRRTELDDLFDDLGLDDLLNDVEPAAHTWRVVYRPGSGAFDNGSEPLLVVLELVRIGAEIVEADWSSLPPIDRISIEDAYLKWVFELPESVQRSDIEAVFDFVPDNQFEITNTAEAAEAEADAEAAIEAEAEIDAKAEPEAKAEYVTEAATKSASASSAAKAEDAPKATSPAANVEKQAAAPSQTIRVELDKLDRLVNLVGELVITQAMVAQRLSHNGLSTIDELDSLDHLTRELQDSAMSLRAQPVKSVFNRVPRIIRELEGETGKQVRLEVEGEMTEVDKTVVERIGEPLTHMIRNAVDHGLETPEERIAAGKPAEGVVRLTAEHRSGRIVISVADDGRGIDLVRVKQKAVERGIITADAQLSDEEIENLIFAPGFSTAATVSNISGRGVGMDVVRRNVQALGGRISIKSKFGQGSVFSLTLPLTLAILDGMIVGVGEQTYVIPLGSVVESLRPDANEVRHLGNGQSLISVRGNYLAIHPIGKLLGVKGAKTDPSSAVLVVVDTGRGQAILMVDDIQEQRQVVVKSLETNYAVVRGLAGATILGDGRVALILDIEDLVAQSCISTADEQEACLV